MIEGTVKLYPTHWNIHFLANAFDKNKLIGKSMPKSIKPAVHVGCSVSLFIFLFFRSSNILNEQRVLIKNPHCLFFSWSENFPSQIHFSKSRSVTLSLIHRSIKHWYLQKKWDRYIQLTRVEIRMEKLSKYPVKLINLVYLELGYKKVKKKQEIQIEKSM